MSPCAAQYVFRDHVFASYSPSTSTLLWRFVLFACCCAGTYHPGARTMHEIFSPAVAAIFLLVTQIDCKNVLLLCYEFPRPVWWAYIEIFHRRDRSLSYLSFFLRMPRQYVIVNQWSLMNLLIEAQSARQKLNKSRSNCLLSLVGNCLINYQPIPLSSLCWKRQWNVLTAHIGFKFVKLYMKLSIPSCRSQWSVPLKMLSFCLSSLFHRWVYNSAHFGKHQMSV